jgi:hypothetical protein
MTGESRPIPPFVVIGLVVAGHAAAIVGDALAALAAVGARPVPSQEDQNLVTLLSPDAGPLILKCAFDERVEALVGIELWISGDLLASPSWIVWEPPETVERERIRKFVQVALLSTCDHLHPLYAGVGVEWNVAPPRDLNSDNVWLPCDWFWASELDARDPTLAHDLAALYGSPGHPFSHGTLVETGGLLNAESKSPAEPIAVGRAAARRLAHSLRQHALRAN